MSVILGINLLKKLYLVSDTRETIDYGDHKDYKDDLIKAFVFSKNCSAVAAGKTTAASFLLNGVKKLIQVDASMDNVIDVFRKSTKTIISDFVKLTLQHDKQIALIIAGFNTYKGKDVKASTLGEAMSGMLVAAGDGSYQRQSINPLITQALMSGIKQGNELSENTMLSIQTINSKMYSVIIDIQSNNVDIKEVPCYEYVIFHPDQKRETVRLPSASVSYLDFREREDPFSDDSIYTDSEHIMSFLNKEIIRLGFKTVGGHIFPLLQTPAGAAFPTGDISTIKQGKLVPTGGFFVDPKNGLSYKFLDGTTGAYRHLQNIKDYEKPSFSFI